MKKINGMAAVSLALAAMPCLGGFRPIAAPRFDLGAFEPGDRLGGNTPAGVEFTDARGQRYVRDERGTVRKVR